MLLAAKRFFWPQTATEQFFSNFRDFLTDRRNNLLDERHSLSVTPRRLAQSETNLDR